MLDLRFSFLCLIFTFALAVNQAELSASISDYYSYLDVPVTFSVKVEDMPEGKLVFPSRYDVGYNELDLLGSNHLLLRKIPFYLEVSVLVPVAMGVINKGDIISKDMLVLDWKPLRDVSQQVIGKITDIAGKENVFYKTKGNVFYKYDVKEQDAIKINDECSINSRVGRVSISMPGVSLKNGSLGSTIKVLNKQTGKTLEARVVDSKNVEVEIY